MKNHNSMLVVFSLDGHRFCLELSRVERVVNAVEISHLPSAPEVILGVINIQGTVVPVFNTRLRFGLPERALEVGDHLLVARGNQRLVALVVDAVSEVVPMPASGIVASEMILPGLRQVEGVVKLEEGMLMVHDLDRFLSLDEVEALEAALETGMVVA